MKLCSLYTKNIAISTMILRYITFTDAKNWQKKSRIPEY